MDARRSTEREIEVRLINYGLAISRLREKSEGSSDETRAEINEKVEKLHGMERTAKERLKELQKAEESSWESVKTEVEKYWDSLGRELKAYDPTP